MFWSWYICTNSNISIVFYFTVACVFWTWSIFSHSNRGTTFQLLQLIITMENSVQFTHEASSTKNHLWAVHLYSQLTSNTEPEWKRIASNQIWQTNLLCEIGKIYRNPIHMYRTLSSRISSAFVQKLWIPFQTTYSIADRIDARRASNKCVFLSFLFDECF